jgi:hypothetical protein
VWNAGAQEFACGLACWIAFRIGLLVLTLSQLTCSNVHSAACAHAAGSENPQDIGLAARQEKLPFTQFWGSSLTFDFDALGPIDVFWIHGAHDYTLVRHQTRAGKNL